MSVSDEGAWLKEQEQLKEYEILKEKQIDKYSDPMHFWSELFGDYKIFPNIDPKVEYEESLTNVEFLERLIKVEHE